LQFYRSLGAVEMKGWTKLRVDGEALKKLAQGDVPAITGEAPR
jgi:hypothetical protein